MKSRAQIKEDARGFLRTGRVSPLVVSAIVIVVEIILNEISSLLDTGSLSYVQLMYSLGLSELPDLPDFIPTPIASFGSILATLVNLIIGAGYISYLMGIRKGWVMPYSSVLDGLNIAGKVIWCNILVGIRIFLWSLLFVIPGIISSYRYRFALYNLIDTPDLSASEAIALSCKQTEGWKMELFVLDVSFIGWDLLLFITAGLSGIWSRPYRTLADLGYFEMCRQEGTGSDSYRNDEAKQNRNDTPWEF